ncbi:pilus assembly protein HofM [Pectobacterium odoriferum]|uniref:Pilus assembly protein HofM n=1 Tax=Pectobacterium odoriferum TaxID=78398 RepID=A0ABD6VRW6_9GAMM|nr:pilus assembly protein PilM [Pectobacterium odoriferum]POD96078.1 pilus assembly protein HofM [Pectobacterium odoriferum]POE13447.1 pilus assembly protein HofM [Pectobacterium odoriferum]POE26645.1 pilus assembly protein HofM [Pectobacterium odoriferum]POE31441.1 pilus assembly protein HofM [Pectobacterium odoriferum]POE39476.1 pilus assembly protein HofM [Pectobacterium odoriferum]
MAYHIWQVGVDIQNGFMRALAVQRRRDGWQLRHWWQYPLPDDTLRSGSLHHTEALCEALRTWHRLLPGHISLRVGFPAQLILQQHLPLPDRRLQEPERSLYIETMAARKLPISSESLAIDYREDPQRQGSLLVTAARRQEIDKWLVCLNNAGLRPDVFEISTCALRVMAQRAGLDANRLLLHRLLDGWLWVSPLNHAFHSGVIHLDELNDETDILSVVSTRYQHDVDGIAYYSSVSPDLPSQQTDVLQTWSPLTVFNHMQPPLPSFPSAFAIAGGLALRPEDA